MTDKDWAEEKARELLGLTYTEEDLARTIAALLKARRDAFKEAADHLEEAWKAICSGVMPGHMRDWLRAKAEE